MKKRDASIKSDLSKIEALTDREIDFADNPELDDSFFIRATIKLPRPKTQVTVRSGAKKKQDNCYT